MLNSPGRYGVAGAIGARFEGRSQGAVQTRLQIVQLDVPRADIPSSSAVSIAVRVLVPRGGASTGRLLSVGAAGHDHHVRLAAQDGDG